MRSYEVEADSDAASKAYRSAIWMCGLHTLWRMDGRLAEQVSFYLTTLRGGRGVCRAEEAQIQGAMVACAHLV